MSNFLAGILVNFFGKPAKHRHLTPQKRERKLEKSRKKLLKLQHTFKFYVNLKAKFYFVVQCCFNLNGEGVGT